LQEPFIENDYNNLLLYRDVFTNSQNPCIGCGGPVDGAPVNPTCDRDNNSGEDAIKKWLKFNSMDLFREVTSGSMESKKLKWTIYICLFPNGNISSPEKVLHWILIVNLKLCGSVQLRKTQWFTWGIQKLLLGNQRPYGNANALCLAEKDSGESYLNFECIFSSKHSLVAVVDLGTTVSTTCEANITRWRWRVRPSNCWILATPDFSGEGYEYNSSGARIEV